MPDTDKFQSLMSNYLYLIGNFLQIKKTKREINTLKVNQSPLYVSFWFLMSLYLSVRSKSCLGNNFFP